jgi:integrase/recombinase XerD
MYSLAQLKRLLRATSESCSDPRGLVDAPMIRALILLLYGTGLRLREALALNSADLDLGQSFLRVRQSKFYKARLVPFGEDLTSVLRQYCI